MTIRFAAAHPGGKSPLGAWRCRSASLCAANDNSRTLADQDILVAALRHFARHGLAAAERAGASALAAGTGGDRKACLHWLAVCRQLDRRMADRLSARLPEIA